MIYKKLEVSVIKQNFTSAEQQQARENIDAVSQDDFNTLSAHVEDLALGIDDRIDELSAITVKYHDNIPIETLDDIINSSSF